MPQNKDLRSDTESNLKSVSLHFREKSFKTPLNKESHTEAHYRKYGSGQRLDKVEEFAVCIVLAKVIEKLRIIQQFLPEPETEGFKPYQVMPSRMTTLQKIIPPEYQEDGNTEALKHIQKCRHLSQQALEKVIQGFRSEGMLRYLKEIVVFENRRYYDNFILKQENLNLNNTICNLKDKIRDIKNNARETRLYLDKMTQFCIKQAATTVWAQSKTLKKNTEVFQQARVDLNNYKLRDKEDVTNSLRDQCDAGIARETLINNEITNHLQMITANLQKKLEKWTARHSEEVDALDIALLQLRNKLDEQQEKFVTISQQHAARQELVQVLQEEADERDKEQTMRLSQNKAALIIQQWWRKILLLKKVHKTAKDSLKKNKIELPKNKKESTKKKKK